MLRHVETAVIWMHATNSSSGLNHPALLLLKLPYPAIRLAVHALSHMERLSMHTADLELLTPAEAALALRTNVHTLERWRSARTGPAYVKIGRRVAYAQAALRAYCTQQTRQTSEHLGSGAA